MKIFRETGNMMNCEVYNAKPLNRRIIKDDYLYCDGLFFQVEDRSSSDIYRIKSFYYTGYDLSCEEDADTYMCLTDFLKDYDIENVNEIQVIDKEVYDKALEIGKAGIQKVKDYLASFYYQNKI